jgi:hypothetical protein
MEFELHLAKNEGKYVPPNKRPVAQVSVLAKRQRLPVQEATYVDRYQPCNWQRLSRAENQERALARLESFCAAANLPWSQQLDGCRFATVQGERLFVQPMKRVQHNDGGNGQERFAFLELCASHSEGWLTGCKCDLIAFELVDGFLLVPWMAVINLAQQICQEQENQPPIRFFRFARQIYHRLLSVDDPETNMPNDERLTMISLERDLLQRPGVRLLLITKPTL